MTRHERIALAIACWAAAAALTGKLPDLPGWLTWLLCAACGAVAGIHLGHLLGHALNDHLHRRRRRWRP